MSSYNITTRRKDKGWQVIVSYKTLAGKWKQKSKQGFATSREAKDYGQVIIDSLAGQIFIESHELRYITLLEFFKQYMWRNADNYTTNTKLAYNNLFKKASALHHKKVVEITTSQVMDVLDDLPTIPSKREMRKFLSVLFNHAVKMQLLSTSPASAIPSYSNKSQQGRIRTISDEDLKHLLDVLENKNDVYSAVLTRLLASTGMRIGEALGLTWNDLNIQERTIQITKQWAKIGDKNEHGFSKPKTNNSIRTLYIPPQLVAQLQRLNTNTERIFEPFTYSTKYTNYISCILPHNSPHDFRHTYATKLLANGVDVKTVAALLGDTVNTVIQTYLHYTDEMRQKAKTAIDDIFSNNF